MQRRISLSIQEEKFKEECKLIDLRYEYHGYTGDERYAIISELTEKELRYRYSNIIKRYEPFILLSMECGEIIDEFHRNEDKFKKRAKRSKDYFGYEDGITETYQNDLIFGYIDPMAKLEKERLEKEEEIKRQLLIDKVNLALSMMKPIQKERLIKAKVLGMSSRRIAQEEGVYYSSVDKSIKAAEKNFIKIYKSL